MFYSIKAAQEDMSSDDEKDDDLFKAMNSYHKNINLTIEVNPPKFLDTKITKNNDSYITSVYRKDTKKPKGCLLL